VEGENSTSGPQPYQPYEAKVTNSSISNMSELRRGSVKVGGVSAKRERDQSTQNEEVGRKKRECGNLQFGLRKRILARSWKGREKKRYENRKRLISVTRSVISALISVTRNLLLFSKCSPAISQG
jgi:hypothetical protein